MKKESKKRNFSWFTLVVLAMLGLSLFVIGSQEYRIHLLKQERDKVQARLEILKAKERALKDEKKRLSDPKYIEKLAREEYNMVGKNEVPLFVVDNEPAKSPQKEVNKEIKKP